MIRISLDQDSIVYNCCVCKGEWKMFPKDYMDEYTGIIDHNMKCLFCDGTWYDAVKEIYTRGGNDRLSSIKECLIYSWNRFINKLKVNYY